MLSVKLICVGKLKEKCLADACGEYMKRLSAFCKLSVKELAEEKLSADPSEKEISRALEKEGERIAEETDNCDRIVATCVEGDMLSSEGLCEKLTALKNSGASRIAFVIGGSFGLSEEIKKKADFRLSMSKMTFPHHLARVMLLEQIYRALSIEAGSKYHK